MVGIVIGFIGSELVFLCLVWSRLFFFVGSEGSWCY